MFSIQSLNTTAVRGWWYLEQKWVKAEFVLQNIINFTKTIIL